MSLVPFTQHPDTPVIFIGDTKQFGPMSVTSTDKKYKALFEAQRRCSLLKRVQGTGHIDFTLSANHRAHGDVHDCRKK
ncbi:hypothetical protein A0O28_0056750 [Trichoderma guizhouense]|uniref:DNA2/NAM7 helicase-like C-terminal domain-containing protein n=1 Tax=Trichoderma guizhouense TaxID=1491466 RepID=A0A1T3C685_9HYPO|nr:hypothetical protein A0O28_0056750 [Trichoderma guizhouense]